MTSSRFSLSDCQCKKSDLISVQDLHQSMVDSGFDGRLITPVYCRKALIPKLLTRQAIVLDHYKANTGHGGATTPIYKVLNANTSIDMPPTKRDTKRGSPKEYESEFDFVMDRLPDYLHQYLSEEEIRTEIAVAHELEKVPQQLKENANIIRNDRLSELERHLNGDAAFLRHMLYLDLLLTKNTDVSEDTLVDLVQRFDNRYQLHQKQPKRKNQYYFTCNRSLKQHAPLFNEEIRKIA